MSVTTSSRRNRRDGLIRRAGWLAAAALLTVAALAPASVAAANPQPQDKACKNIDKGGRSPAYVWTTVGADGVTAHWATDSDHFDSAHYDTVVVRVCVLDEDDDEGQGGIDQNTENDGIQLFPWSLLGYEANPCPDSDLTFGSSVDGTAAEMKKSNIIECPSDAPTTQPSTDSSADPSTEPTTSAPSDEPSTAPSTAPSSAPSAVATEAPIVNPTAAPSGEVEGVAGTPRVTPPPTDTMTNDLPVQGGDAWRAILVLVAAGIAGTLVAGQPRRVRRRA